MFSLFLNIAGTFGGIIGAIGFNKQGIIWAAFVSIFLGGANFTFAVIKAIKIIKGDD
jgi:hypothetical protein